MLKAIILCATIFLTISSLAQTSQYNSNSELLNPIPSAENNPLPGPGTYAAPFVPLISTPSVSLPAPVLQVGATNGTGTNFVGAQNVTASSSQLAKPSLIEPRINGDAHISSDVYPRPNSLSDLN